MATVEKKVCAVCKEEHKIKDGFYTHPKTKKLLPVCKKCTNAHADNQMATVEFCREHNIYFDMNLHERALVAAKKDNSIMYFGYYLKLLNMNKGAHGKKSFKDSLFDITPEVKEFHETKNFEIRLRSHHCRVCQSDKPASEFFSSASPLDSSGLLSVCKKCSKEIFLNFYQLHGELHNAIYETCAILDYEYYPAVVDKLIAEINEVITVPLADKEAVTPVNADILVDTEDAFVRYLAICSKNFNEVRITRFDFYGARPAGYEDYKSALSIDEQMAVRTAEKQGDLKRKWGKSYDDEEVASLESMYSEWDQKKDLEDPAVSLLIRQLCMHQLDIEKKRASKDDITKKDYESLTLLMDKAGATPNKSKLDSEKGEEAWGVFIQTIEKGTPAVWLDQRKDKYFDTNNIEQYINSLFVRSLKNFITGSRDFSVLIDETTVRGIEAEGTDVKNE